MNIKVGLGVLLASIISISAQAKQLRVLAIGNSFSQSMMREFPNVAAAFPDCELNVVNMMIGGCPLDKHWANVELAEKDPKATPYGISKSYAFDKEKEKTIPRKGNIPQLLVADKWDIVTIQQASGKSPFYETYQPYADKLIAKIKELAPQAQIWIQQTWSYTPYDGRLEGWKKTPEEMYESLKGAYDQLAKAHGFKVIPVGDAVQLYRSRLPVKYEKVLTKAEIRKIAQPQVIDFYGDVAGSAEWKKGRKGPDKDEIKLRVDGSHLNKEGHYLQACVWLAALFDVDVTKLTYAPKYENFTAKAELMRKCAAEAVAARK